MSDSDDKEMSVASFKKCLSNSDIDLSQIDDQLFFKRSRYWHSIYGHIINLAGKRFVSDSHSYTAANKKLFIDSLLTCHPYYMHLSSPVGQREGPSKKCWCPCHHDLLNWENDNIGDNLPLSNVLKLMR